jgi:hypothetical protein
VYHPLAILLGRALALALVPFTGVLTAVFILLSNAIRCARRCDVKGLLAELFVFFPFRVCFALFTTIGTASAILNTPIANWSSLCTTPWFPWFLTLFSVLPVWRSPTEKLRVFAGTGDVAAVRLLLCGGVGGAEMLQGDSVRSSDGAGPDRTDKKGRSELQNMCRQGRLAAARALLKARADPNLREEEGKTALHFACGERYSWLPPSSHPTVVKMLLEEEWATDPNILEGKQLPRFFMFADNSGKTAFMVATPAARLVLAPVPGWDLVVEALETAGKGVGAAAAAAAAVLALLPQRGVDAKLRKLQLFDLLWDEGLEPAETARVERRRLVFEKLIMPLVRATSGRKLEPDEKALLIYACRATAGPELALGKDVSRSGHRAEFDALMAATMSNFGVQLAVEYAALAAQPSGAELLSLPCSKLLHCTTPKGLRQDASNVGGGAHWLRVGKCGDLAGAYRNALKPSGAVDSPESFCLLLQGGRNQFFAEPHLNHFNYGAGATAFWRHICALHSVARHKLVNAEFHSCVQAASKDVTSAKFRDAPLKNYERVIVKAEQYHAELKLPQTPEGAGAAVARVIDIVRCSFEVPDAQSALAICTWLDAATLEKHGLLALRRKNGFHEQAETSGGYRDIKYNLLFQSHSVDGAAGRVIAEVQILVVAYLRVKKKMHAVYRIARGDFG